MVGIGDGVINFVNKMERGIADGVGGALTQKAAASWPPTPKGSMATQLHCHCTDWGRGFDGHPFFTFCSVIVLIGVL